MWCLLLCWASTSGLEVAAAVLDAWVHGEGVKWAAKALIALLDADLAEGWGVACVGVPLALGLVFFTLGGVSSAPPPPTRSLGRGALLRFNTLFLL